MSASAAAARESGHGRHHQHPPTPLALDFDGTLAPIVDDPEHAYATRGGFRTGAPGRPGLECPDHRDRPLSPYGWVGSDCASPSR
jgi:hypothetical protein